MTNGVKSGSQTPVFEMDDQVRVKVDSDGKPTGPFFYRDQASG